ncbi:hypothetical protein [Stenotrophomonas rhizophila]|uniref:hypothetical protein n=1 Tax=Stenotrophomonas rhizophila TaxID=216778 RepID=UPI003AF7861D
MPLALAAPLKLRLVEQLSGVLRRATVYADTWILSSALDGLEEIRSIPDKGEVAEELQKYIGDGAFQAFVVSEISGVFQGPGYNADAGDRLLISYDGYHDPTPLSEELVSSFCTLPWQYEVSIRLPEALVALFEDGVHQFELSPRHRIVSGAYLAGIRPLRGESPNGLASLFDDRSSSVGWDREAAYFQVDLSGYVTTWPTESFMSARDDIFSFFGLGVALGLFYSSRYTAMAEEGKASPLHVHFFNGSSWIEQKSVQLEQHQQHGVHRLSVTEWLLDRPHEIAETLRRIGSVFGSEHGRNVLLSGRWLFDSNCGQDELLSYVQAAVAIEILLGDEDADPSLGLTTLMANRCAYLVGRTQADRTQLLKNFRDIYKVRSKIVHRGKSRLNNEEIRLFYVLQSIIRSVINVEQRMLERAEQG